MARSPILIIGATGLLGRPVARRLIQDGLEVRALVRNQRRARRLLPGGCELVSGDLQDPVSLARAMEGVRAVHVNLAAPMARTAPEFEPERDGMRCIIDAARKAGVPHVLRLSAMGVEESAPEWWAAQHKAEADQMLIDSGIPYTIFRPTWFMESIASFIMPLRLMLSIDLPRAPLRWIAGDDFATQVEAAILSPKSRNRTYHPQGPELVTMREALERFRHASPHRLVPMPVPRGMVRLAARVLGRADYFDKLLTMTIEQFARLDEREFETDLPRSSMRIEDYAKYVVHTGDRPRKF